MENNKNYKGNKKIDSKKSSYDRRGESSGKRYDKNTSRPRQEQRDYIENENVNTEGLVVGRNAVRELLTSGREIDKLLVQRGEREGSIVVLVAEAINRGIPVVESDKAKLDAMCGHLPHQGIIAMASEKEYCDVDEVLETIEELENLDDDELENVVALMEYTCNNDASYILSRLDHYTFYSDLDQYHDCMDELIEMEMPQNSILTRYFDYDAYHRDCDFDIYEASNGVVIWVC